MKNTWLRLTLAGAMAGGMLLAAPQAPVQQAPNAAQHQRGHNRGARLATYLNLTPEQRAQARAAFQSARQAGMPIRRQLKQVRTEMFQAVRADDTARIDRLSAREGRLRGQLLALRHEAFAKMYATLTPAQQAKADQLPAHFRQMRQSRTHNG